MCITAANICSFIFDSVPNQYKTQEMCDKAVDNYPSTKKYVPDRYKTQEISDKAVDDNPDALEFVPDRYKTREMCDKAVDNYSIALELTISDDPFSLRCVFDQYKAVMKLLMIFYQQ